MLSFNFVKKYCGYRVDCRMKPAVFLENASFIRQIILYLSV